jgi:hypothetical protein
MADRTRGREQRRVVGNPVPLVRAHAASDKKCLHRRLNIGLVLASNVEGCAMRRGRDRDWQSAVDRHTLVES